MADAYATATGVLAPERAVTPQQVVSNLWEHWYERVKPSGVKSGLKRRLSRDEMEGVCRRYVAEFPADPFAASRRFTETIVSSRVIRKVETTDEMIEEVEATLLGDGTVRNNDVLVIISGAPMWVTGTTNLLKFHRVGERR